ncbi:hypothetical protein AB0L05_27850 [Nonomuraea pusilla]|uniref:hypothetical protein n=1 Tax=Nonomuraea pusilla TaxID=46177 RepID=UPI00332140CF
MTAIIQDALFGDDTPPPPRPAKPRRAEKLDHRGHQQPPRRDREWNALTDCAPTCLACGAPEPPADAPAWPLCPTTRSRCATICAHTTDPYKADLCLITVHVHAQLVTLPNTGRTIAAVTCPYCDQPHAHDPTPGSHYRISRCTTGRKPYIVHVPERSN